MPNIGLMIAATDADDVWYDYIDAFKRAIKTPNPKYVPKPLHGARGVDYNTYKAAALELIQDGVDVIVTAGNLAAKACKDAAYPTPPAPPIPNPPRIVVASAGDLTGLADQNLTGCTNGQKNIDILKARIEQMKQLNPAPTGVAIVGNDNVPPVQWAMNQALQLIPQKLNGIPAYLVSLTQQSDLQNPQTIRNKINFSLPNPNTVNVVYVCSDPLLRTHGHDFVIAAHNAPRLNTMHEFCEWVNKHDGDRAFGPDFTQLFIKAAGFVDQYFSTGTLPAVFNPKYPDDCVQCFKRKRGTASRPASVGFREKRR